MDVRAGEVYKCGGGSAIWDMSSGFWAAMFLDGKGKSHLVDELF